MLAITDRSLAVGPTSLSCNILLNLHKNLVPILQTRKQTQNYEVAQETMPEWKARQVSLSLKLAPVLLPVRGLVSPGLAGAPQKQ